MNSYPNGDTWNPHVCVWRSSPSDPQDVFFVILSLLVVCDKDVNVENVMKDRCVYVWTHLSLQSNLTRNHTFASILSRLCLLCLFYAAFPVFCNVQEIVWVQDNTATQTCQRLTSLKEQRTAKCSLDALYFLFLHVKWSHPTGLWAELRSPLDTCQCDSDLTEVKMWGKCLIGNQG